MKLPVILNLMKRAIGELGDPPPTKTHRARLREFFDDRCCYCGQRTAHPHLDHADPRGGHAVGNRLLACMQCNSKEKRESLWEPFLRIKCGADDALFIERRARIRAWLDANASAPPASSARVVEARAEAVRAIATYRAAYERLRVLVADGREP